VDTRRVWTPWHGLLIRLVIFVLLLMIAKLLFGIYQICLNLYLLFFQIKIKMILRKIIFSQDTRQLHRLSSGSSDHVPLSHCPMISQHRAETAMIIGVDVGDKFWGGWEERNFRPEQLMKDQWSYPSLVQETTIRI